MAEVCISPPGTLLKGGVREQQGMGAWSCRGLVLRIRISGVFKALSVCGLRVCVYGQTIRVLAAAPHADRANHKADEPSDQRGCMGHEQRINEADAGQLAESS